MDPPYALKRRRLNNDAINTLRKPFVSPLKNAQQKANSSNADEAAVPNATAPPRDSVKADTADQDNPSLPDRKPPFADSERVTSPKSCMALELEIKTVRNDIETLRQATRITEARSNHTVQLLTRRWRTASQQAADELFLTAKERVAAMGGVSAMKKNERARQEQVSYSFDAQDPVCVGTNSEGDALDDTEKQRWREDLMIQARDAEGEEHAEEDQDFTMDVMLRSMNIEFDLIGYDKENEQWLS